MQSGIVGRLYVEIAANYEKMNTGLKQAEEAAKKAQQNMESGWQRAANKMNTIGNGLTAGLTAPLIAGGIAAIKYASDLEETLSKVDVVFGDSADRVKEWADTAVEQMGLASETAMSAASTYGNMADGMGIASETGLEMARSLTQLSADLASFNNTSQETAQIALNSVFTGETETLKQYGIVMTQTNLQQFAMQQGITKTIAEMTQAEQVQLRYNYVLANTANAQGDFARTSDSVANQTRMAKEQFKQVAATLGQNLLPMATKVLKGVNSLLDGFNNLDKDTQQLLITLGGIAIAAGPAMKIGAGAITTIQKLRDGLRNLKNPAADAASAVGGIGTGAKAAVPGVKTLGLTLNSALGIIGLVATAATTLIGIFSEIYKASEDVRNLTDSMEENISASQSAQKEYEKNVSSIKAMADTAKDLTADITELTNKTELSAKEQKQLEISIDKLNDMYPDLELSISNVNEKLGTNADAVIDNIAALEEQEATMNRIIELEQETRELENQRSESTAILSEKISDLDEVQKEQLKTLVDSAESGVGLSIAWLSADDTVKRLWSDMKEFGDTLPEVDEQISNNKILVDSYNDSLDEEAQAYLQNQYNIQQLSAAEQAWVDSFESKRTTLSGEMEQLKSDYDSARESAVEALDSQINKWNELEVASNVTTKSITDGYISQAEYMNNYTANMESLMGRNIDGLAEWVRANNDGSTEAAAAFAALANSTDEEITQMLNAYQSSEDGQEKMADSMANVAVNYDQKFKEIIDGANEMVDSLDQSGAAYDAGVNTAQGLIDGVNAMKNRVSSAYADMAQDAIDSVNRRLKIHSPSKIFMEIGEFTGLGMIEGIENQIGSIQDAYLEMAESAISGITAPLPKINSIVTRSPMLSSQGVFTNRNIEVNVPVQVMVSQSLSDADIKRKAKMIGEVANRYIGRRTN